jgi:hypothetical protein
VAGRTARPRAAEDANLGKALGDARKIVVSNQNLQFTSRNPEQLKPAACRRQDPACGPKRVPF